MEKKSNTTKKNELQDEVLFSVPLFAKFLESQKDSTVGTNKRNDDINTPKYPYDNSDISNASPNMQVVGIQTTNKKKDTIYSTMKYPSDTDEYVTLKYPSDADDIVGKDPKDTQTSLVDLAVLERATTKWPSDNDDDDTTAEPTADEMIKAAQRNKKPAVTLKYPSDSEDAHPTTKPNSDVVHTMKYPSDGDEEIVRF